MRQNRSGRSVVQSSLDFKAWLLQPPTVEQARPARCPQCDAASCPLGGRLQLHGHGLRERQVCGPLSPDGDATEESLLGRRYRCIRCSAVIIVVPREIRGRWQYSAAAIAFALALWGLVLATTRDVRKRVSPRATHGVSGIFGWKTVRRWAGAVRERRLFPATPSPGKAATLRQVAASAAAACAACASPLTRAFAIEQRAFLGAAQSA